MLGKLDLPKILKRALKNGGDFADLYAERTEQTQIISEDKQIEKIHTGLDCGIGLRVLSHGHTAYAFTSHTDEKNLLELADTVALAFRGKYWDKEIGLTPLAHPLHFLIQKPPSKAPMKQKVQIVEDTATIAWGLSDKIKQVKIVYQDTFKELSIANSNGEYVQDKRTYTSFYVMVTVSDGQTLQTGYHPVGGLIGLELLDQNPPEDLAKKAVYQALLILSAPKAPGGTMPVVLSSEAGGTMIHEAVGHGLEADLATEGFSVYQNRLGEKIAGSHISVIDDATLPQRRGSFSYDDEGTPSQRTLLIENGVLKSYMHSRQTAKQNNTYSTGNGRRESYRHKPIVRMTNTCILPGQDEPVSIIRTTDSGLFVKKMGGGQVNTVNGDFVFEVSEGYLIKKGKIDHAVRGATLIGNGPKVLQTIDKIGSDLGYGLGTCGKEGQGVPVADAQPTLRIPEIVVGGAV